MTIKRYIVILLISLSVLLPSQAYAQSGNNALTITVLEGQHGTIDGIHMVQIVVRVSQVGSSVTFKLPSGSGVTFPGDASQVTMKTDPQGIARSGVLTARSNGAELEAKVEATNSGQTATDVVHISTAMPSSSTANTKQKSHKRMWIAIIGAAAAGGALAAIKMGGGSSGSDSSVTITPGAPSVGAP